MAIAFVTSATGSWTSGTSFAVTVTAPTNGNTLVLFAASAANSPVISSVSQTGATWVQAKLSNTNRQADLWYATNVSGAGTTVTINLSGTPASFEAIVAEFSGLGTATLDASKAANSGNSTTPTTGSCTPTASRNALIIASTRAGGAVSAGPTNSFNGLAINTRTRGAYLIVPSTSGSYSTGWTAGTGTWDAAIAALLVPASGSSPTATITSQSGYSTYEISSGRSITFTGTGSDPEDGTLTGASLVWTSSLDGALGTGVSITTSALSVGTHTITLTATDSATNTGTATKTVVVKDATTWHLIQRHFTATPIGFSTYTFSMQVLVPANYNSGTAYKFAMELGGSAQRTTTLDDNSQLTDGYAWAINNNKSVYSAYNAIWCLPAWPNLGSGYGGREYAYPMIAAALAACQAEWNIDTTHLVLTGYSLGAQVALESLYNASPAWAAVLAYEGCVTGREGLLSGQNPSTWPLASAAAEVAGRNPRQSIRHYQDDADTNNTPANAQITRDAFWAVDPGHSFYFYLTTSGLGHVGGYQNAQGNTTNLDWAFGITRSTSASAATRKRYARIHLKIQD